MSNLKFRGLHMSQPYDDDSWWYAQMIEQAANDLASSSDYDTACYGDYSDGYYS